MCFFVVSCYSELAFCCSIQFSANLLLGFEHKLFKVIEIVKDL